MYLPRHHGLSLLPLHSSSILFPPPNMFCPLVSHWSHDFTLFLWENPTIVPLLVTWETPYILLNLSLVIMHLVTISDTLVAMGPHLAFPSMSPSTLLTLFPLFLLEVTRCGMYPIMSLFIRKCIPKEGKHIGKILDVHINSLIALLRENNLFTNLSSHPGEPNFGFYAPHKFFPSEGSNPFGSYYLV